MELLLLDAYTLLSDDILIRTLSESRNTEQIIASKLKTIEIVSSQIQRAREAYSAATKRAALLYFVVIDLHAIMPMFRFTLEHFIKIFVRAVNVSNKQGVQKTAVHTAKRTIQNQKEAKRNLDLAMKAKQEEHMKIILHNFTSDLYQSVTTALTPEDGSVFTYWMIFKILEAEGLMEKSKLYTFLLNNDIKS